MLAMPCLRIAGEYRYDNLRLEPADHPDGVLEELSPGPSLKGFVERACVPKIVGTSKKLTGSLDLSGCLELSGANQSEANSQLRADQILTTLAS